MADIFISYSKRSKAETEQLAADLRGKGFTVWYDTSLVPGDSFRDVIMSELALARAAIVIWTADSVKSDWVLSEASRARARRILIPVRADDVRSHDIPPPFDGLHTELLSNRSSIEAALAKLGVTPTLPVASLDDSGLTDAVSDPRATGRAVGDDLSRHAGKAALAPSHSAEQSGTRVMQRQLAAILFADVAGYTRLMDAYEGETHPRIMTLFGNVVDPIIASETGRIVRTQGDSFLACFASVNNAINAAISIQQEVNLREASQPREKQIAFRMGLHSGDVVVEATDIYGAGVNLAARLQELAEPGSLLISGAVYDQLGSNLKLPAVDLGYRNLKNIANPVRILKIETSPGRNTPHARASHSLSHSRPSIAVLPFAEYGVAADQGYFGDGLVEDMAGALASLPDVFVISRSSTLKYRESPPIIPAIASELGVRYVLWGSVRRRSERLRISAELADAETQEVIEQHRVEGNIGDLFTLQDHLVERVLQKITPNIRDTELRRIRRKRPESLDAYDCLLRGLDLLYRPTQVEFEQARQMFEQSIMLDENYAAPHAFLALWNSIRIGQGWSTDRAADLRRVEEFSSAALLRDPNDVWALALSGHLRALLFRDFDAAFDLFDRALHASPNSAFAWSRSSPCFSYFGDPVEARRRAEEALRLSPFDPHIFFTQCALGLAAYTEGDYARAVAWGRRCYAGNPAYTANLRFLAASLAAGGQIEEARQIGESLRRAEPRFAVRAFTDAYAFRDKRMKDRLAQHLLLAGLPE
jgi:adenylate cyclase